MTDQLRSLENTSCHSPASTATPLLPPSPLQTLTDTQVSVHLAFLLHDRQELEIAFPVRECISCMARHSLVARVCPCIRPVVLDEFIHIKHTRRFAGAATWSLHAVAAVLQAGGPCAGHKQLPPVSVTPGGCEPWQQVQVEAPGARRPSLLHAYECNFVQLLLLNVPLVATRRWR